MNQSEENCKILNSKCGKIEEIICKFGNETFKFVSNKLIEISNILK